LLPFLATVPAGSCPRTRGARGLRYQSMRSEPHIPQAFIWTRISSSFILGVGISSIRMSCCPWYIAAFMGVQWFLCGFALKTFPRGCMVMLACEPLCLSTQSVISLSVKTLLKHVVSVLFLLNSARFLSVKSFGTPSFSCRSWRPHV